MLSLCELERAARALVAERRGARLERVVQPDDRELVLTLAGGDDRGPGDRAHLLLSCRAGAARVSLLERPRKAPPSPPGFAQYLKSHLEGARLRDAELLAGDRQLALQLETKEGRFTLLLSILGPRSNVYLLDGQGVLQGALRSLDETRRDLKGGEPWRDPETKPPPPGEDRFADVPDAGLLAAIEARYAEQEAREGSGEAVRRLRQALKKQRGSLERKARGLRADVTEGEKAADYERQGELLKGALRQVRKGASQVEVTDYESGERLTLALDPKLTPAENLERFFKRHRKATRGALRAAQELGGVEERLVELDALAAELDRLAPASGEPDAEGLAALAARPAVAKLLARYFPAPKASEPARPRSVMKLGRREIPTRLRPKRYLGEAGLEIWVGKNDDGNDLLTTRLARGRDLFFHLEGNPGSHVVLRVEGKGDPPQSAILEAAELAVHFSKGRHSGRAPVHVAAIKDVSKPRGAKPGLVHVHRGRSVQLRRDPERLKRLLEARIED